MMFVVCCLVLFCFVVVVVVVVGLLLAVVVLNTNKRRHSGSTDFVVSEGQSIAHFLHFMGSFDGCPQKPSAQEVFNTTNAPILEALILLLLCELGTFAKLKNVL